MTILSKDRFLFALHSAFAGIIAVLITLSATALAQEMPAPHRSPREPVNSEPLPSAKPLPPSHTVEGPATIIDGEKLRVNDVELRLFGVIPPQLSASFGPQARATLDVLTAGQNVNCDVRDRDHDGRFLATCRNASGNDLALELLRRGLAVTARGSLQPTELSTPYLAAEEAAQAQKLGLWSVNAPPAASLSAVAIQTARIENNPPPPAPAEVKSAEKAIPAEKPVVIAPIPAVMPMPSISAPAHILVPAEKAGAWAPQPEAMAGQPDFFARYQLLITGLVMLVTAFGILGVITYNRRHERIEEMKAIAAALRGELSAARAVCHGRLKTWSEADDKSTAWPRIRASLYQAYVGRLGWLGATLARQIASIYGQASDYGAYYNMVAGDATSRGLEIPSKRPALEMIVKHIDEVLPRLVIIERTGIIPNMRQAPLPSDDDTSTSAPLIEQPTPSPEPVAAPNPVAAASVPSAPVTPATATPSVVSTLAPLWGQVRRMAGSLPERARKCSGLGVSTEAQMPDYASSVEEDMTNFGFSEDETGGEMPSSDNVAKFRGTGS